MSTDIKPGQVWARNADPDYVVKIVWAAHSVVHYERPRGEGRSPEWVFRRDFHLVKDVETTPAPPDPTRVKAGDTVTVRLISDGQHIVTIAYADDNFAGGVAVLGMSPESDQFADTYTLTDHQPAPVPEREWEPGTFIIGTVNGGTVRGGTARRSADAPLGFVYWNEFSGRFSSTDAIPADARTLVVIDPADVDVDALLPIYEVGYNSAPDTIAGDVERVHGIRAVLSHLGIEAS